MTQRGWGLDSEGKRPKWKQANAKTPPRDDRHELIGEIITRSVFMVDTVGEQQENCIRDYPSVRTGLWSDTAIHGHVVVGSIILGQEVKN
jgi:hypothetical protein